jgi:hypothetical protein
MKCENMNELLSAYVNGETSGVENERIKEHLSTCSVCQKTLADYVAVRQKLITQRIDAIAPDIKEVVMSRIKEKSLFPGKPGRWIRPTLITIPVVAILVALMILQPWNAFMGNQSMINKIYAASLEVKSYRFSGTSQQLNVATGEISNIHMEGKCILPNSAYERIDYGKPIYNNRYTVMETIIVNGMLFIRYDQQDWSAPQPWATKSASIPGPGDWLSSFTEAQALPDEEINGVTCLHYKSVRALGEIVHKSNGVTSNPDESLKGAANVTFEAWAGKEDLLPRRIAVYTEFLKDPQKVYPQDSVVGISDVLDFYYGEPIQIEPPIVK